MVRDLLQLNNHQKRFFAGILTCIALFAIFYGTLVKQTVAHVVARRAVETETADLSAHVSLLEEKYMKALTSITLERAHAMGFSEASPAFFVSRDRDTLSVRYDN